MSGPFLGLVIEALVAVLLVLTIGYCIVLNGRIRRLRSDESVLRATIGELLGATEAAQQSITHLRTTVQDADRSLGERLSKAEKLSEELGRDLERGEAVLAKIARIAGAADTGKGIPGDAGRAPAESGRATPRAERAVAVAQAIASRTRTAA